MISSNKTTVNLYLLPVALPKLIRTLVACRQIVDFTVFLDERKISDFFISKTLVSKNEKFISI